MTQERLRAWRDRPVEEWAEAWGVPALEIYGRIGSTSDRALRLASEDGAPYTLVLAEEQTAGRGRRGTNWHSAPGVGIWMSVVLPGGPLPHVTLLVGLAVAEALEEAVAGSAPGLKVSLKWPNDLVTEGRKLGGILCESAGSALVAGIGINVRAPASGFPGELVDTATSLEARGAADVPLDRLPGRIVARLIHRVGHASPGTLAPEALAALGSRDALADRAVVTEEHGPGTARGIEADGSLVLERPDGSRVRVVAGSVRLP